jgi:hypothetical protein
MPTGDLEKPVMVALEKPYGERLMPEGAAGASMLELQDQGLMEVATDQNSQDQVNLEPQTPAAVAAVAQPAVMEVRGL